MRMVRWICGFTRWDRIRNGVIRDLAKVTPIEEKMRESRLWWFGHVKRRSVAAQMRRCEQIDLPSGKSGRGRLKKSLDEVVREDLKVVDLTEDLAHDRRLWRDRIRVLDCGVSTPSGSVVAVA